VQFLPAALPGNVPDTHAGGIRQRRPTEDAADCGALDPTPPGCWCGRAVYSTGGDAVAEKKLVRLNLELSAATKVRIERLQDLTDAGSMTEVVRRALATYEALIDMDLKGGSIVVKTADGNEYRLLFV
jgi:hypothetical protein